MYHSRLVTLRNMFNIKTKDLRKIVFKKNKIQDDPKDTIETCIKCLTKDRCSFNQNQICFPNK